MAMVDKMFGKPPEDMTEGMWTRHWVLALGAMGALMVIIALVYGMWVVSDGLSSGHIRM